MLENANHLQVTYAAKESLEVNSSPSRIIKLFGVTYHLYSQGLPLFGQVFASEFRLKMYF